MTARRKGVPHYPVGERAVHGDSRISYHGTRLAAEKRGPELAGRAEAYGRAVTFWVEKCPYCRAFVVMRHPKTLRCALEG